MLDSLMNDVRNKIKNQPLKDAIPIIEDSILSIEEKYQLLREIYRVKCVEFDKNYRISGMTFEEWTSNDIDDWVGCFWPSNEQCDELEKYIYNDFLDNYRNCNIDIFSNDYFKIKSHTFKYNVTKLLFEQILVYPKIIKSFNNITKDDIWNSLQWLIYLKKIKPEDSLIAYNEVK